MIPAVTVSCVRGQELADFTLRDIRVEPPPLAVLTGKGRKTRHVPLGQNSIALLNAYLNEHRLNRPGHDDAAVFVNPWGSNTRMRL
jgi:integrase/recombinase XerD